MNFRFEPYVQEGIKATLDGHVVHRLEAHLEASEPDYVGFEDQQFENGEVGYIQVTYVPSEEWERRYTGPEGFLRFMGEMKGWLSKTAEWSRRKQVVEMSRRLDSFGNKFSKSDVQALSDHEIEMAFEHYIGKLEEKYGKERKNARKFHADKPRVEFIRVAENYRRQGIGTALYRKMAEILNDNDMPLCSTNLQREAAEKAWEALVQKDWAEPNETQLPFEGDDKTRYELFVKPETKAVA